MASDTSESFTVATPGDPADDKILYTPEPDYNGTDSFTNHLTDIFGATFLATVSLTGGSPLTTSTTTYVLIRDSVGADDWAATDEDKAVTI